MKKHSSLIKKIKICLLIGTIFLCSSPYILAQASEKTVNTACVYRNILNSKQQSVYDQVYYSILEYKSTMFSLVEPISEDSLCETMNALFNDHPELFWVNTSYQYAVDPKNIVHKIQLSYGIAEKNYENVKTEYDRIVNGLVAEAAKYDSDYEKEKFFYDAICSMNTYNSNSSLNQSAYSALTSGSSVCAGYSRAFQILCNKSGIPCYYITGISKGESHAWNVVVLDGIIYNVDLTWDDCISEITGKNCYYYFNKNDLEFSYDHSRSDLSSRFLTALAQQ